MRTVALDVHKRFAEVAVHEDGEVRRLGRIETGELRAFAESLGPDDHVVLESTSMTWSIAELLARHAGRVTVSNPMGTKAIASAKVKTDKVDAKVLAQLGAADFLPEVWAPDEATRALRRRVAHRASLVRQRTRLRNQIHAVLARNLVGVPVTDLFGREGRRWLSELGLPRSWERWLYRGILGGRMSQETVELLYRAYEAFNRRDLDALLALCAPEVEFISYLMQVEGGDPYRGHAGVRSWWERLLAVYPDFEEEIEQVRDLGDLTIARVRMHGRGAESDAPTDQKVWAVGEARQGKVIWWRFVSSEAGAVEAAGTRK
jgi:ketosteroid isomerase-like protein